MEPGATAPTPGAAAAHAVGAPMLSAGADGGARHHETLVAALEHAAATAPEAGIKYVEQGCCTFESYATLLSEGRKMTHALRALGIAVGEPIALQITEYARTSVLQPRASRRATALAGDTLACVPPCVATGGATAGGRGFFC